ncbi:dihydroxy-acid dehydratase [Streptomyces sp. NBC_00842]|uniref:dihydroxy-acid dehydratase domain-containing protein n=1 Tax=Streptomyces sp. NBC_00842 TaxID=2975848 RepID=UPI003866CE32
MYAEEDLRSRQWFGGDIKNGFIAWHHLRATGLGSWAFDGRPVVGICQSASDPTPCNRHLTGLAEAVERGVLRAGGVPLEFPVFSPGEPFLPARQGVRRRRSARRGKRSAPSPIPSRPRAAASPCCAAPSLPADRW